MNGIITLILGMSLLFSPAARSQQTYQTQPGPVSLEADPAFNHLSPEQQAWVKQMNNNLHSAIGAKDINGLEQIKLDAVKHQVTGMTFCGHVVDQGTFVDAVSQNASESAFAIRWLDPKGIDIHSAIFTARNRCVVTDGQTVDGKLILRAMPNSLAVSNQHALTAWEAEFYDSPVEQSKGVAPHRGIFIENRLLTELDPRRASPPNSRDLTDQDRDFHWNTDQETLAIKPGVVLVPVSATAKLPPCPSPAKRPGFLDKLKQHAERTLEKAAGEADAEIAKGSGGNIDIGVQDSTTAAAKEVEQPTPCQPVAKPK